MARTGVIKKSTPEKSLCGYLQQYIGEW